MRRPTPEQLAPLSRFERIAFEVADAMNRPPAVKAAAHSFLRVVGEAWVTASTDKLLHLRGVEHVRDLKPDRGVFLVANHRSFFDFYVISAVVLRNTDSYTLPLALRSLQATVNTEWGAIMAGSAIATLPLIVLFIVSSRQLIAGLTTGAVK